MSYVKALYGHIIGEGLSLQEGQIGHIENDKKHVLKDLEKRGLVIIKDTYEEAEAFKYIPSKELFNRSYKSLNPPEGENASISLIDWENSQPTIVKGVPSNYIIVEEVKVVPSNYIIVEEVKVESEVEVKKEKKIASDDSKK